MEAYAGLNDNTRFAVLVSGIYKPTGGTYEVTFAINPLPTPALIFATALAGLGLTRRSLRKITLATAREFA